MITYSKFKDLAISFNDWVDVALRYLKKIKIKELTPIINTEHQICSAISNNDASKLKFIILENNIDIGSYFINVPTFMGHKFPKNMLSNKTPLINLCASVLADDCLLMLLDMNPEIIHMRSEDYLYAAFYVTYEFPKQRDKDKEFTPIEIYCLRILSILHYFGANFKTKFPSGTRSVDWEWATSIESAIQKEYGEHHETLLQPFVQAIQEKNYKEAFTEQLATNSIPMDSKVKERF